MLISKKHKNSNFLILNPRVSHLNCMYILLFALLAGLGYGGLLWRDKPMLLGLSIIAIVVLMLAPMDSDITFTLNTDVDTDGSENGETTDLTTVGTDTIVLLSLTEGWNYTVWLWLHVALLLVLSFFFLSSMLGLRD